MNRQSKTKIQTLLLLSLVPFLAFANAGSPMMWFGMLHLLIINAMIGCLESMIIRKYNIENKFWLIILANYCSMLIGLYYIAPYFSTINGNLDFWGGQTRMGDYELKGFFTGMASCFVATIIIELPFFYFAVKNVSERNKIFIPFIVANITTNIIMTLVYYLIVVGGAKW